MIRKYREVMIIIVTILLVVLIGIGVIMVLSEKDQQNDNDNQEKDYRCVNQLCISKVTIDETNDLKSIIVELKNEGQKNIERQCVKISTKEQEFNFCLNDLKKGASLSIGFDYTDEYGKEIKEYKLEEGIDEDIVVIEDEKTIE